MPTVPWLQEQVAQGENGARGLLPSTPGTSRQGGQLEKWTGGETGQCHWLWGLLASGTSYLGPAVGEGEMLEE